MTDITKIALAQSPEFNYRSRIEGLDRFELADTKLRTAFAGKKKKETLIIKFLMPDGTVGHEACTLSEAMDLIRIFGSNRRISVSGLIGGILVKVVIGRELEVIEEAS